MVKIDWKKNLLLAIPITAVIWAISFAMTKLNLGQVQQLYVSIPATSGITPTLGAKGLVLLGGLIPLHLTIPAILVLAISAFATLVIGNLISELLGGWTLKNFLGMGADVGKIATYIIFGAAAGYLLFVGLKMPSRLTILGLLIHTFLVAVVSTFIAKKLKLGMN